MTARHEIRVGKRRLSRDRAAIDATPAPRLGEMLQLARERKGVDLFRAERDTKIRLKYLAALEDSDFAELPAPVYTKGFLRNYAIYLGLDPEEVLSRWRDELALSRKAERPVVTPPPQPLAAPRRGLTLTPGMFMAGLVLLVVIGFLGYIGMQMVRFLEAPAVALTQPRSLVSEIDAETTLFAGAAGPGALISIHGPDGLLLTTTANESGEWSREVPLAKGRNDFTVTANDPVTRRDSDPLSVIVTVPLAAISPDASASPVAPGELRLTLLSPAEGSASDNGMVDINGTTSGTRINITGLYLGPLPGSDEPSPSPSPSPAQGSPGPGASDEPGPSLDLNVGSDGRFGYQLDLPAGEWQIVVTAYSSGLQPTSESRSVTVTNADLLELVIEANRGDSWMRITTDGTVLRGWGGPTLRRGSSVTVTAQEEVLLRVGNAGALRITQNGVDLGVLGRNGQVGNWVFRPGMEPEQVSASR